MRWHLMTFLLPAKFGHCRLTHCNSPVSFAFTCFYLFFGSFILLVLLNFLFADGTADVAPATVDAYLYSVLHPLVPEWHFQCISLDGHPPSVTAAERAKFRDQSKQSPPQWPPSSLDVVDGVNVTINQSAPFPALVCVGRFQRCFESNATHAVMAKTATISTPNGTWTARLKRWTTTATMFAADGRWPYCKGGGGLLESGLNVSATCGGAHGGDEGDDRSCLDLCLALDGSATEQVFCRSSWAEHRDLGRHLARPTKWISATEHADWKPWRARRITPIDSDVVTYDTPVVAASYNLLSSAGGNGEGDGAFAYFSGRPLALEADIVGKLCVRPVFSQNPHCHVVLHGVCYLFDKSSWKCVNFSSKTGGGYPSGGEVFISWAPKLVRSSYQPGRSSTEKRAASFCLLSSRGRIDTLLACLEAADAADRLPPLLLSGEGEEKGEEYDDENKEGAGDEEEENEVRHYERVTGRRSMIVVRLLPYSGDDGMGGEDKFEMLAIAVLAFTLCFYVGLLTISILAERAKRRRFVRLGTLAIRVGQNL